MMLTSYDEYYWHSIGCLESARHVSLFKSGFLVVALSLMAGCAAPNRANKTPSFSEINIPPRTALHPAQPHPDYLPGTPADAYELAEAARSTKLVLAIDDLVWVNA